MWSFLLGVCHSSWLVVTLRPGRESEELRIIGFCLGRWGVWGWRGRRGDVQTRGKALPSVLVACVQRSQELPGQASGTSWTMWAWASGMCPRLETGFSVLGRKVVTAR